MIRHDILKAQSGFCIEDEMWESKDRKMETSYDDFNQESSNKSNKEKRKLDS